MNINNMMQMSGERQFKGSNDSEESTNMGAPLNANELGGGSSSGSDGGGGGGRHQAKRLAESAHHDPRQRRIYLGLMGASCLSALLGLGLILVWMLKYRSAPGLGLSTPEQLSNLHPVLMFAFMVSLNMYAALVYRTHYASPKEKLKWTHAILSGANIVMSLLGVFAMFRAHQLKGQPNFYSLHSWIGALVNALYLSQFILGFVAFLRPGMSPLRRQALMPWHRAMGAGILALATLAAVTGIGELVIFQDKDGAYSKFTAITFVANLAAASAILMTAISIYLLRAAHYQRPRLPEEEPLKR